MSKPSHYKTLLDLKDNKGEGATSYSFLDDEDVRKRIGKRAGKGKYPYIKLAAAACETEFGRASNVYDDGDVPRNMYDVLLGKDGDLLNSYDDGDVMTNYAYTLVFAHKLLFEEGGCKADTRTICARNKKLSGYADGMLAGPPKNVDGDVWNGFLEQLDRFARLSFSIGNFTKLIKGLNNPKGNLGTVNDQFALFLCWCERLLKEDVYKEWLTTMVLAEVEEGYLEACKSYREACDGSKSIGDRIAQLTEYLRKVSWCIEERGKLILAKVG